MLFTTSECAWQNTSLTFLDRRLIGIRGFEIKKSVEKEHLYAAGAEPIDIQDGNKKYEGNIKILKFELDMMNDAAQKAGFSDVTEIPHPLIMMVCQYKKLISDPTRYISVLGIAITEMGVAMEQNAKMTEITLPYLAMNISHFKK